MRTRDLKTGMAALGVAAIAALAMPAAAPAAVIGLTDFALNVDGGAPPAADLSAFDTATGLGTITVSVSGPGLHFAGLFVDHEIDAAANGFVNETGMAVGTPAAGESWEIDEPGFGGGTGVYFGDIYANLANGALDNALLVNLSDGTSGAPPDDISMALGWDFLLTAEEEALIRFVLSTTPPSGGFYLVQTDPDSAASVYF